MGPQLYLIFDRAITTALTRLDEISAITDPREQLAAFIAHQARMVARDPGLFAVAFDERGRIEDAFNDRILQKEREYLRRVTRWWSGPRRPATSARWIGGTARTR